MANTTNKSAVKDATAVVEQAAGAQREKRGPVTLADTQAKGPAVDGAVLERLEKSLKASKGHVGDLEAALEAYLAGPGHGRVVHGTVNTEHVDVVLNCTCPLCLAALKLLGRGPKTDFP